MAFIMMYIAICYLLDGVLCKIQPGSLVRKRRVHENKLATEIQHSHISKNVMYTLHF
jgi:hypothetical protein